MNKFKEKVIEKARELGWAIRITEELNSMNVDFYKHSPRGEDFNFTIFVDDFYDVPREVFNYFSSFDPEIHVENWVIAKRDGCSGVPGIKELLIDAEAIENMLGNLANVLMAIKCSDI